MSHIRSVVLVLVAALTSGGVAEGALEIGDAGQSIGTAQVITDPGPLNSIIGHLTGIDDIDIYGFNIPDLSLFSATTVSPNTEFLDTQLFLFRSDGLGVIANDDTDPGLLQFNATIPLGSLSGIAGLTPGAYFLAVAEFADKPHSTSGLIFPDLFPEEVVTNTGPGGLNPLLGWTVDGFSESLFDPFPSQYEIVLTGAQAVPEPSVIVTMTSLFALTGLWLQFRKRRLH